MKHALGFWTVVTMMSALVRTDGAAASAGSSDAGFAGSRNCRSCHESFYRLWAPSHHGLAMQPYTADLGKTNLSPHTSDIKIGNTRYRADIAHAAVIERGPQGEKRYSIAHAMGGKNVFYFLTPLDRGRLQVLPVAYDLNRKEWYDTAASAVRHFASHPDEALPWTDPAYTFNTACFGCHVSQWSKNYDLKTKTYRTTWAEPGINCETCHGPAAEHLKAVEKLKPGEKLAESKLIGNQSFTPDQMNSMCGSCHAKMYPLSTAFKPGDRFYDHFGLLAADHADFYPDGRDLGENFTYTSWRLSPCLESGKLHCVSCHTSSGRMKFAPDKLNDACLPCHAKNVENVEAHSHHKAGTAGAKCVSCHMPKTEFARMRRSDHSMRPPTPAATLAYGSPNACNLCHTNRAAPWADARVREWHARDYQAPIMERASWIAAARKRDWSKLPAMVDYLKSGKREEIWAASLIQLLRHCEDDAKWPGIEACLKASSPLVRAAAVEALGDRLRPEFIPRLVAAARDDYRLVRVRAAGILAGVPDDALGQDDRPAVSAAFEELKAAYGSLPDDASSHYNLGNFFMDRREYEKSIASFQTAIELDARGIAPMVNVSMAYNALGQNDKAEASLREAARLEPTNAAVHLNLGMLQAEVGKPWEAEKAFRAAFKSDPQSAQAAYNLGVLVSSDRPAEAVAWCRKAAGLRPADPKYAYTLAFYLVKQNQLEEAASTLEKSLRLAPTADAYALLGQIYEQQDKPALATGVYRRAVDDLRLPESQRAQFEARMNALGQP